MRYMGGKTRIAKQIAAVIDQYREPGQLVWDAFCGGLSVSVALSKKGPVLASDACAPLMASDVRLVEVISKDTLNPALS